MKPLRDYFESRTGTIGVNAGKVIFEPTAEVTVRVKKIRAFDDIVYAELVVDGEVMISATLDYILESLKRIPHEKA